MDLVRQPGVLVSKCITIVHTLYYFQLHSFIRKSLYFDDSVT